MVPRIKADSASSVNLISIACEAAEEAKELLSEQHLIEKSTERNSSIDLKNAGLFTKLPTEVVVDSIITANLSNDFVSINNLVKTSKDFKFFFQDALTKQAKILLQCTSKAKIKKSLKMAKKNHLLALKKETFTEEWCGQRKWTKPISSLQYAAWAGDTEMCEEYLKLLPKKFKYEALQQLEVLMEQGTEHGVPLAFIYDLLNSYLKFQSIFEDSSNPERWHSLNSIGKKQMEQ